MNLKNQQSRCWNGYANLRICLFLVSLFACTPEDQQSQLHYIDAGSNVWHLELLGDQQIVTADYHGNIALRSLAGVANWTYPTDAFVFDLKLGDLDGNGQHEILAVTAQGQLLALNLKGELLWEFNSKLPLFNIGIGDFTGDHKLEIACGGIDRFVYILDHLGELVAKSAEMERLVHRLAVGDLDNDGKDNILVIENRTVAQLLGFKGDSLISLWRKPLQVPDQMVNWENPGGSFFPFSIEIEDLDGDEIPEILMGDTFFNKQAVMVTDHTGDPLWISDGLVPFERQDDSQLEFYSTAFVRASDLYPEIPGKEVISVAGGMFRIWDREGNLLGSQNASVGFTDIEVNGDQVFLSSSPNGDDHLYRIDIGSQWEHQVANIEYQGKIEVIKANTETLRKQVDEYIPDSVAATSYDLVVGFGSIPTDDEGLAAYQRQYQWLTGKFPYPNLKFVSGMKVIEHNPPLDENGQPWSERRWRTDAINGTYSVEEIVEKARWIEEHKIPTTFLIGHSCMPFITLETAEKILQVAPEYAHGFHSAEDEQVERLSRYFDHYFTPLANLCLQYGNKLCMTKNKGLWWMSTPSFPSVFDGLFGQGRDQVSAAATEDSNSRTPEINLMGRGGLWQAGLLKQNEVSIHGDLFSFNRFHQWEYPKAGHPYLRLLVAHTTMGMTRMASRIREFAPQVDSESFTYTGAESTEIFYHMLGKGLVFSPEPEDILGYSPVGMVIHQPSEKWLADAHNGHRPELWQEDEELHQAIFPHNGSLWGMTNTPEHAFQKVVFNKSRQFGYQVPPTPYGLVAMVPEQTDLSNVANIEEWWHTDGIYIWKDPEQKYTGREAADLLRNDFSTAAKRMPFRQTGDAVFMQVIRMEDHRFRLFLVDPGWLDPQHHDINIAVQLAGDFKAVNVLNKQDYPVLDQAITVPVEAGLFTIVDVFNF